MPRDALLMSVAIVVTLLCSAIASQWSTGLLLVAIEALLMARSLSHGAEAERARAASADPSRDPATAPNRAPFIAPDTLTLR